MRVLWVGDAGVASGFGMCTHAICDHLHEIGHEVHVLGLNWHGRPDIQARYPYHLWPCWDATDGGQDGMGVSRLPILIERLRPDVVILLNDPWNVPGYLDYFEQWNQGRESAGVEPAPTPMWIGWLAVDALNQHAKPLNRLDHVAVWTQFAADELQRGGYLGESSIIPLGVDTKIFEPKDKAESRKRVFGDLIPEGAFVVGVVGRNQPRKRLDLSIQYFSEWIHLHGIGDAYLYLHVGPTGDQGVNIESLVRYHGLGESGKYGTRVLTGRPDIGQGYAQGLMPYIYSAFDVLLTTTQGEGWGLPAHEAMACEVPVIAPDWSALGCWAREGATLVPCSSTAPSAPLNSEAYTLGGVMDRDGCIKALQDHYVNRRTNTEGRKIAESLTWESAAKKFADMLHEVTGKRPMPKYQVSVYVPTDGTIEPAVPSEARIETVFRGVEVRNEDSRKVRVGLYLAIPGDDECDYVQAARYGGMSGPFGPGVAYLDAKASHTGDLVFPWSAPVPAEIIAFSEDGQELDRVPVSIAATTPFSEIS